MLMTGDQQLVKQMNRMALVRMLCREPALSRADLAVRLGLTKSTVGMLVRELVEEGWLSEAETVTTGGLGRRPTPLHVDNTRLALLGIDVGVDEARLVATTLTGETLATTTLAYADPPCHRLPGRRGRSRPAADPGPRPARPARAGRGRGPARWRGRKPAPAALRPQPGLAQCAGGPGGCARPGRARPGRPAAAGAERSRHGRAGRT